MAVPAKPVPVRPALFPRSARTYVGRQPELARIADWLERETVFLIYGVGGIGKSELVYKAVEAARAQERWRDAVTALVRARPGMSAVHGIARLRFVLAEEVRRRHQIDGPDPREPMTGTGGPRALDPDDPREPSRVADVDDLVRAATLSSNIDDHLAETAHLLDTYPSLVFIDDIHHIDLELTGQFLGYISRHVRNSRLFVASRQEIPLPPRMPPPVILRLAPLDPDSTAAMVDRLADQLGIEAPDANEVFHLSGGSPFFVQRLVARTTAIPLSSAAAPGSVPAESALDSTLRDLSDESRRMLLVFAILRGGFTVDEVAAPALGGDDYLVRAESLTGDLARRFLVDASRDEIMVHDLVRDALTRLSDDAALADAHRTAARIYQHRFASDERNSLDAVEAICHLLDAGDSESAWQSIEAAYSAISAAGLDNLLADPLARIASLDASASAAASSSPEILARATARDLMWARIAIRQSLITEAAETLQQVAERGHGNSYRYAILAGEVARRQGGLRRAESFFAEARDMANSGNQRFHGALQLADVRSLRGMGDDARSVLEAAVNQYEPQNPRDRGRWGWSLALSYGLDENFARCINACHQSIESLANSGADDLILILTTLQALARAESNDIAAANALLDNIDAQAARAHDLRRHLLSLYTGVVRYAEGKFEPAIQLLESSYGYFSEHADRLMSRLAGYYLNRTLTARGDLQRAFELSDQLLVWCRRDEMRSFLPSALAAHAQVTLALGRIDEAEKLARETVSFEPVRYHARWIAYAALARCRALAGDLPGAREHRRSAQAMARSIEAGYYELADALETAAIELMGGDLDRAVAAASTAWRNYAACGRLWLEARAAVTLAAALASRGTATDIVALEEPLDRALALVEREGYPRVRARAALVRAAVLERQGESDRARDHLIDTVRHVDAYVERPEIAALRVALGDSDDELLPGEVAVLTALGFTGGGGVRYRIVERDRDRVAPEREVVDERARRDLVVEPARATITVSPGERADQGRPVACELLARLIEGQGAVVTAEELFCDVWGGREYHPLRNRNTVYVAVKRLRQTLRKLLGDREVIETASGGWRIADDIDAISIRPVE